MRTVVAVYDTEERARDAIEALIDAGFERDDISLATRTEEEGVHVEEAEEGGEEAAEGAAAGAGLGVVVGGLTGLAIGLSAIAVPGLGAVAAAGPLAGLISGGLTGAVAGGVIGALVELGVSEEEAEVYAEAVRRGSTLVAVRTHDERADNAESVLDRFNPVDVERRSQKWREEGWEGFDEEAEPFTDEEIKREREAYAAYETEDEDVDTLVHPEDVADIGDRSEWREDDWRQHELGFRHHYQQNYADTDEDYEYYVVAYRYGYNLANNSRYEDYDWSDIESDARQCWEDRYGEDSWSDVREAVHTSYYRCSS
jgi:hypothetical protein